jgi:hypothetical protein
LPACEDLLRPAGIGCVGSGLAGRHGAGSKKIGRRLTRPAHLAMSASVVGRIPSAGRRELSCRQPTPEAVRQQRWAKAAAPGRPSGSSCWLQQELAATAGPALPRLAWAAGKLALPGPG